MIIIARIINGKHNTLYYDLTRADDLKNGNVILTYRGGGVQEVKGQIDKVGLFPIGTSGFVL